MIEPTQCEKNSQNKCRNCIHFDVCEELEVDTLSVNTCKSFKDKNKFVELPCKVGDEIYDISFDKDNDYNHINIYTIQDVSIKGVLFANEMMLHSDLGEFTFLKLDQARAKLRELEGNTDG